MIHMLSRFDLKPDVNFAEFRNSYMAFTEEMQGLGLVEGTSRIGQRELDTPMDTDAPQAQEYYAIMTFRDRRQLDDAYAHMADQQRSNNGDHLIVKNAIDNHVFTCWHDLD